MLFVAALVALTAQDPSQVLQDISQTYKAGGDFSANFQQTYVDKLRGKKKVETGKLWAKKDGRVRWSYATPVKKDFVYTGSAAYFYEPENAQVTVFEKFQDSPLWNALRFLWGQGSLTQTFNVSVCKDKCPTLAAGELALTLLPKEPIAAVDHVVLVVDPAQKRVRRSLVYDALGNRTEYDFLEVAFEKNIDAKKFEFTIPKGVNVLRATSQGS